MKLALRVALTLAVLVVPFSLAVAAWEVRSVRQAFETQAVESIRARMDEDEREACEQSPQTWPRPGLPPRFRERLEDAPPHVRRRMERRAAERHERRHRRAREEGPGQSMFAYSADFVSRNPEAPPFDPDLRADLESGAEYASRQLGTRGEVRMVAARMSWREGDCAYVMVVRRGPGGEALQRIVAPALIISIAAVLMAVLAVSPIVRRIVALTRAVGEGDGAALASLGGRDEIGQLASEFERARARIQVQLDEIEAREAALRSYVADTNHDVALPLTVLSGHLTALDAAAERGESVDRQRLRDSLEECHYLGSLLRNLNVAAKLEAGERGAQMHELDLGEVIARVVGRNQSYATTRGIELNFARPEAPLLVRADTTLVEQAISNLVHNAIRYGREAGHVAAVLAQREGGFELEVIDDGPGIAPADLARITERGFRGDAARTRHPTGTGLGLAIVRDVAARHGWELSIENRDEGGLRVVVRG